MTATNKHVFQTKGNILRLLHPEKEAFTADVVMTKMVAWWVGIQASYSRGCSWFKSLVIGYPKALDRECVMVNGAAVSALGKTMQFHRERLNVAKVIEMWLSHLPLKIIEIRQQFCIIG
uniref:Uncharacterized protein n=1 Tax=Populus trichocarpa TaxID=3694 RepID=U5GL60_POPTR